MPQPARLRLMKRPSSKASSSLTRRRPSSTHRKTGSSNPFDRPRDYDNRNSAVIGQRSQAINRKWSNADDEWDFSNVPAPHRDSRARTPSRPNHVDAELSQTTSTHHTYLDLSDLTAIPPSPAAAAPNATITQTTIVVKVWINYDPIFEEFYHNPTDRRAASCGQVILSPRQRARIETLLRDQNRGFRRIRLDIGTPFRPLAHVFVAVMPPESMPPPGRQQQQYDHGRSRPWLGTSIVAAEVAQRRHQLTRELWDSLRSGIEMLRGEVPADPGGGGACEILLEDLDRWAGYFLHRQVRVQTRTSNKWDWGWSRYVPTRPTREFWPL